jgi:hypothetical protein
MSIIGSDNLSLLMGDGAGPETFNALKGLRLARFELTQKNFGNPAISSDAWGLTTATADRRALIEGEALANDEAASLRLRSLAMNGTAGNVRLELSSTETISGAVVITSYRETIAAGDIKQVQFRLESTGALTIA